MEIPKEIYVAFVVAIGLLIERTYIPLRLASNTKQWPQRVTEATAIGIITIIASFLIARVFYSLVVTKCDFLVVILRHYKTLFPSQYSGTILCGFLIMIFGVLLANLPFKSPDKRLSVMRRYGSPIEQLFIYSMIDMRPLVLTFKNGWVYVVYVTELPKIGGGEKYLGVLAILSGYKGEDNRDLTLKQMESGEVKKSTVIVLDDLMSVSHFDIDKTYNKSMQPTADASTD
ncbi:MAG: hypothetical protein C1942_00865 [Prosthecochloris sp.]|uniref:hypothetical protein n=1 Tax=Prosthecochloris sp. TaxID=290513 RepID=UPI0013C8DB94|nr:hypothetical protein [Prosthecochloris sp.]NEX11247.1 hypothetical protein [Prosthecochloris sp.]